jgi:hypothetical protein
MTSDPLNLLQQLSLRAGSATAAGRSGGAAAQAGVESASFAELLEQVRAGVIGSGRTVGVATGSEIELSEDVAKRLSAAADKAEAAGIRQALVILDDRKLVLDVATREVRASDALDTAGPVTGSAGILAGIDGVIDLTERQATRISSLVGPIGAGSNTLERAESGRHKPLGPPGGPVSSASLSALLSRLEAGPSAGAGSLWRAG